jgi:predicted nucleic acid-binding protein
VILVDVNLLLVATIEEADGHAAARAWFAERLSGSALVGLPWSSLMGFVRIAAQPRPWERPVALRTSPGIVRSSCHVRACGRPSPERRT